MVGVGPAGARPDESGGRAAGGVVVDARLSHGRRGRRDPRCPERRDCRVSSVAGVQRALDDGLRQLAVPKARLRADRARIRRIPLAACRHSRMDRRHATPFRPQRVRRARRRRRGHRAHFHCWSRHRSPNDSDTAHRKRRLADHVPTTSKPRASASRATCRRLLFAEYPRLSALRRPRHRLCSSSTRTTSRRTRSRFETGCRS